MDNKNGLTITEVPQYNNPNIMIEINKWLEDTYQVSYNKTYELYKLDEEYSLYLHLNKQDRPLILSGQFTSDEAFIEFCKKELRFKRPFEVQYFNLYKL
jgi:hypothetical protein